MLSAQEVQALLRAVQSPAGKLVRSQTNERLVSRLGFGRIVGKQWLISERERAAIADYLCTVEGISADTPPHAWRAIGRIAATDLGRNEKLAGVRPREGRIALRAVAELCVNDRRYMLPPAAFMDMALNEITRIAHGTLLVVENFAAFVNAEHAALPGDLNDALILYRGDSVNPPDALIALLHRHIDANIIAWPDFDPAGLQQSAALPGVAGILAPADAPASLQNHGRDELYLTQGTQADGLQLSGECERLVRAIRLARRGMDQEKMIATKIPMRVWHMMAGS